LPQQKFFVGGGIREADFCQPAFGGLAIRQLRFRFFN